MILYFQPTVGLVYKPSFTTRRLQTIKMQSFRLKHTEISVRFSVVQTQLGSPGLLKIWFVRFSYFCYVCGLPCPDMRLESIRTSNIYAC